MAMIDFRKICNHYIVKRRSITVQTLSKMTINHLILIMESLSTSEYFSTKKSEDNILSLNKLGNKPLVLCTSSTAGQNDEKNLYYDPLSYKLIISRFCLVLPDLSLTTISRFLISSHRIQICDKMIINEISEFFLQNYSKLKALKILINEYCLFLYSLSRYKCTNQSLISIILKLLESKLECMLVSDLALLASAIAHLCKIFKGIDDDFISILISYYYKLLIQIHKKVDSIPSVSFHRLVSSANSSNLIQLEEFRIVRNLFILILNSYSVNCRSLISTRSLIYYIEVTCKVISVNYEDNTKNNLVSILLTELNSRFDLEVHGCLNTLSSLKRIGWKKFELVENIFHYLKHQAIILVESDILFLFDILIELRNHLKANNSDLNYYNKMKLFNLSSIYDELSKSIDVCGFEESSCVRKLSSHSLSLFFDSQNFLKMHQFAYDHLITFLKPFAMISHNILKHSSNQNKLERLAPLLDLIILDIIGYSSHNNF